MGIYDRIVIQELIKTVASTEQLDTGCQKEFKAINYSLINYPCLIKCSEERKALRRANCYIGRTDRDLQLNPWPYYLRALCLLVQKHLYNRLFVSHPHSIQSLARYGQPISMDRIAKSSGLPYLQSI